MASSKAFDWQVFDGESWYSVCNDVVIETHYCQPGASGIKIITNEGSLYIDFDAMTVQGPAANLGVRRNVFLSNNQKQEVGWYYKDNNRWCEYGSQGSGGNRSSVRSDFIEQQYNSNPRGSVRFTAGNMSYIVDFTAMTQTNLSTSMTRKVRRRPKFNSIVTGTNSVPVLPSSASPSDVSTKCIWEFMGDEGIWTEFQKPRCSLDSAETERLYQLNPHSVVSFTAGRHKYTLNFAEMCQVNNRYGTKRAVRRTAADNQQTSSPFSQAVWQFKDIGDNWTNYSKGGRRGQSSVSSQDIEAQYQQDSTGKMSFRAGRFNYELDFSDMTQTNLSTNTRREVRRLQP